MRYFISVILFSFALSFGPTVSNAQRSPTQTFKHKFENYTLYLRVNEHYLETWRVDDEDNQCLMYPSTVEYTDSGEIKFPAGTVWKLDYQVGDLVISFPNGEKIKYTPTDESPMKICGLHQKSV